MTDQHRVDTLGCYGNPVIRTPALDGLAAEGARFDRFYTPTAICTPARASLFTGLHPFRHGLLVNPERNGGGRDEVAEHHPVLSAPLQAAGYNMGHVGKWHIGRERGPEHYGIDGEHLPGALNPFHHPSYQQWLKEQGHPPFAVERPVFGKAPPTAPAAATSSPAASGSRRRPRSRPSSPTGHWSCWTGTPATSTTTAARSCCPATGTAPPPAVPDPR
ncbi:sulfatase-like hydrolase/transferase [Nonomuraea salmonea]|uniref:sulfatase-like hydrolase/transferase n=1 Tax=Nonomuraea salmonea TaxID=46181 RepID=UPI0031EBF83C